MSNASTKKSPPARLALAPFGLWPKLSSKPFPIIFPSTKNNSDCSSTTPSSKANLFASIFASNSNLDDQGVQPHDFPLQNSLCHPLSSPHKKFHQNFFQLETSKSKGPDGIPAIVLKTCAPELAPILNKLFQLSYTLSTFPTSFPFQKR